MHNRLTVVFLFSFLMLLTACERSINPYEDREAIYSVYGTLEVGKTLNYIRVRDLKVPLAREEALELDAKVTFENLEVGSSVVLEDTVVRFGDNITHNFIVNEPIKPLGRYRITVERPDGATVQSLATGPHVTEVVVEPGANVACEEQIEFLFKNVPEPEQIRMEVGFYHDNKMQWSEVEIVAQPERIDDSDDLFISMSPRNLMVEVFTPCLDCHDPDDGLIGIPLNPRILYPTVRCRELQSNVAHIRYTHFGPEWKAVVPVWPVNPDHVLDVENGFGFLGAFSQEEFEITIDQGNSE